MDEDYQVIIVGCGPAGLAAGLYASRGGLSVLLLGDEAAGGGMRSIWQVENYPGFPDGVSGAKLGLDMMKQAMKFGLQFKLARVEGIEPHDEYKAVRATLIRGGDVAYRASTVILAGGASPVKLGVAGESEFLGKGVSYCGVCDAPQFKDRVVVVAGGGDSGLSEALYLSRLVSEIIVVEIMPHVMATKILHDRALADPKIQIRCGTRLEAIRGDDQVREVELVNALTGARTTLPVGGVLVRIGLEPNTGYLKGLVSLDDKGYVLVDERLETSVPGIFAAGDTRHGSDRQIATAVGDGVTAALSAHKMCSLVWSSNASRPAGIDA
ncbi:MAG: FAD-dependent oxidoreductase [bacterium]|nr:FAD-dependent oxidoreductase [bacterium]